MLNKTNIGFEKKQLIVYIVLIFVTFAVFWQVNQHDFITFDDRAYVTQNPHIQSGFTPDGVHWAFTTKYFGLWNPLVWLSFMADYQLFGLKAGGYHLTNLIFHMLSTLLLFRLFNRMTGALWKSAFVAGLFALHPLHVESVAWIAERKDVLSAFFWMLTLCFYVYYTEKPIIRRYLLVLFSFILALMSKPMAVTLPVIMILLDYWPLKRFEFQKGNLLFRQLKEKIPFFVLSIIVAIVTLYSPANPSPNLLPLDVRVANAIVSFVIYLEKTLWPYDLAVLYPFPAQIMAFQVIGASFLIIVTSIVAVVMVKRLPYLFVGWFWYVATIAPVVGIIQISLTTPYATADRYHYLPSIGIAAILAWGVPSLIKSEVMRKNILFPAGTAFLAIMAILAWQQCGYWKNTTTLFNHALRVTKDNYVAHNNLGFALFNEGKIEEAIDHYNEAVRLTPNDAEPYFNRGTLWDKQGKYKLALDDFNRAVELKPDYADAYSNRGNVYSKQGNYQRAIEDYYKAGVHKPDDPEIYYNLGVVYSHLGQYQKSIDEYNKAISLKPSDSECYNNRGAAYTKIGRYRNALEDFNKAISLKPDFADARSNRAFINFIHGNNKQGCLDAQKACELGNCMTWEASKKRRLCN